MHTKYTHGVHLSRQHMRDLLVKIASEHKRLVYRTSGYIRESGFSRELDVEPCTVHRLLRPEELANPDLPYAPKDRLCEGLMPLTGCASVGEVRDFLVGLQPVDAALLKRLIRPPKPKNTRHSRK